MVFDCVAVGVGGGSQAGGNACLGGEFSQTGAQNPVLDADEELRGVQSGVGDPVAVGALDAADQCPGFQALPS